MEDSAKIASVTFTRSFGGVKVIATLDDGTTDLKLFTFFPDELSFSERELVGKTVGEARQLRHDKDVAYLRS